MRHLKKFCPKCGRLTERLYDNLCADCFLSEVVARLDFPKKIIITQCKSCGNFFDSKMRPKRTVDAIIDSELMRLLKQPEVKEIDYRIKDKKVYVKIELAVDDEKKIEERVFDLVEKDMLCQRCVMKKSKYYNALLQLRVPENKVGDILKFVEEEIASMDDELAFVSDIERLETGANIRIGSKVAAKQVAKAIKHKFGAELKITRKLVGEKKGKKLYRDTILVKIKE